MTEGLRERDPRQVGAYRLLGRLGSGGMGEVFLGESPGHRKVAVKLLRTDHADETEFRQRFAREVEAAKRVGGFHTAPVVDADPDADPPWLVTAYIPGPSLADAVKRDGPLDAEAVSLLGAALAEGVAAIHACGLVHRDLKPANIILAADGPRIIDFGIARTPDATDLTSTGILVGTVAFMSPEQIRGERVDARSDVFSLGGVLTYAATGRGPFEAPTIPAIMHRIGTGEPDLSAVGEPLRGTIASCLAKDPAARPGLPDITAHLTGAARPATYVPPVQPPQDQPPPSPERINPPPPSPAPLAQSRENQPRGTQPWESPQPPASAPRKRGTAVALAAAAAVAASALVGALVWQLTAGGGTRTPAARPSATPSARPSASPAVIPTATANPSVGPNPSQSAAPPSRVPAWYVGHWHGTLRNGQRKEWPTLTITKGAVGEDVGSALYPVSGCVYTFQLVSARPRKVTLYESIDSGPCVSKYVVLTPSGVGLQDSEYKTLPTPGGVSKPTFTGHLTRG